MNRVTLPELFSPDSICPTRVGMNRKINLVGYVTANICPTRVGMNRRKGQTFHYQGVHLPHTRGDEPYAYTDGEGLHVTSAPHAWG